MKRKRAMLLCAGRGQRLRPLTDTLPKPLVRLHGKTLLDHQLDKLETAGFTEVMINVCWLADQIIKHLMHTKRSMTIEIQREQQALETGGGIALALPWLCRFRQDFAVVNVDIWHDFDLAGLDRYDPCKAHLVLSKKLIGPGGDFDLLGGKVQKSDKPSCVFTGISCMHSSLFDSVSEDVFPLIRVLDPAIKKNEVSGELHEGFWSDLGSRERLEYISRHQVQDRDNPQ